jgi:hypothetical protein
VLLKLITGILTSPKIKETIFIHHGALGIPKMEITVSSIASKLNEGANGKKKINSSITQASGITERRAKILLKRAVFCAPGIDINFPVSFSFFCWEFYFCGVTALIG